MKYHIAYTSDEFHLTPAFASFDNRDELLEFFNDNKDDIYIIFNICYGRMEIGMEDELRRELNAGG